MLCGKLCSHKRLFAAIQFIITANVINTKTWVFSGLYIQFRNCVILFRKLAILSKVKKNNLYFYFVLCIIINLTDYIPLKVQLTYKLMKMS